MAPSLLYVRLRRVVVATSRSRASSVLIRRAADGGMLGKVHRAAVRTLREGNRGRCGTLFGAWTISQNLSH